jgi:Rod binding domain-containing protein
MSTISGFSSSGFSSSGLAASALLPSAATPALGKGAKAAREFEAQLIGALLQSLEKTFAAIPGQDAMAGEDDYNYLGTQALASAVAAGGGFGIARLITQHLGDTKLAHEGLTQRSQNQAPAAKVSVSCADGTT